MRFNRSKSAFLSGWMSLLLLSACVSTEPRELVPTISQSPEQIVLAGDGGASEPEVDFGLTATVNESDSLTNISVLPGIRVRSVSNGGPADRAGIRAGDVILSIDGLPSNQPDILDLLALETTDNRSFEFEVRRNTTVFQATVAVQPIRNETLPPVELYRTDPVLLRAGFTTEHLSGRSGEPLTGARIVRIFDQSPLLMAGLLEDDVVVAVDEQSIGSAQGLVTMISSNYQAGDRVNLQFLRRGELMNEDLRLWHPGTRLSELSIWPLFSYESSLSPDQTRLRVGDLILFSLFQYQRTGPEREYSVLGIFRAASGFGELVEE